MPGHREVAERFLACLEALDAAPIEALLTEDVVEILPLAPSGGTEPAVVFEGREAVVAAQSTIVSSFSSIAFTGRTWTESADGATVFVESVGERVHRESGSVYRNTYVKKFEFRDDRIARITEYSNPVAFATFFGLPIG